MKKQENLKYLAYDPGHDTAKLVSQDWKVTALPSRAAKVKPGYAGDFGLISNGRIIEFEENQRIYTVATGEAVELLKIDSETKQRTENPFDSKEGLAKLFSAIHDLYPNAEQINVERLGICLAVKFYKSFKKAVKQSLENIDFNFKVYANGKIKDIQVKFSKVDVIPQCYPGFLAFTMDRNLVVKDGYEKFYEGTIAYDDIGGATTEIMAIVNGVPSTTTLYPIDNGMDNVFELIKEKHPLLRIDLIRQALIKGEAKVWYNGAPVDITEARDEAYNAIAEDIHDKKRSGWNNNLVEARYIIFGGGGGETMYSYLDAKFPHETFKFEDPKKPIQTATGAEIHPSQIANAKGTMIYLQKTYGVIKDGTQEAAVETQAAM